MLCSINHGLLTHAEYGATAVKGWNCLARPSPLGAVRSDGLLGWCQPGGASPNGKASSNSTSDFCVGAFLLGGSELATMLKNTASVIKFWRHALL